MRKIFIQLYCFIFGGIMGYVSILLYFQDTTPIQNDAICNIKVQLKVNDDSNEDFVERYLFYEADQFLILENAERRIVTHKGLALLHNIDIVLHNNEKAKQLSQRLRILCWVSISSGDLVSKGSIIRETWGSRCNVLLFGSTSDETTDEFPVVKLDVPIGNTNRWLETKAAWQYIHKNHMDIADWFLFADDKTFLILENFRHFLIPHKTTKMFIFGNVYKESDRVVGNPYVLSKETLKEFIKIKPTAIDPTDTGTNILNYIGKLGVTPIDTVDSFDRQLFHPNLLYQTMNGNFHNQKILNQRKKQNQMIDFEFCSRHSVSFLSMNEKDMFEMYYFIYELSAYGT